MAKETFYNLPQEKRDRIVAAAITEIANAGYDNATIDNVILKAGISKGSFYQYFENKKDLMLYIMFEVLMHKKIAFMGPALTNINEQDFFTNFKDLFVAGLQFASSNPELDRIGTWFMRNTEHPIFQELLASAPNAASNIYDQLLQAGIDNGDLRPDFDLPYFSHMIAMLTASTIEYFFKQHPEASYGDSIGEIQALIDQMIEIMRIGIGQR